MLTTVVPLALGWWSQETIESHLYIVGTLGQALMDSACVILFLHARAAGNWRSHPRDRAVSAAIGLTGALAIGALKWALTGQLVFMGQVNAFPQALALPMPWNMIAATAAILAYGPGEAIFIVYLVRAFDRAAGDSPRLLSWGVALTGLLWGVLHLGNIVFFGPAPSVIANAIVMVAVGLAMGVLLKTTRASLGPIMFWTLTNGTSL
jgi:hypothetical protein